jgi:cell division protein FtsB
MTVITFAKRGIYTTAFDIRFGIKRNSIRQKATISRLLLFAAIISIFGALVMFALGVRTLVLTLSISQRASQISALEKETEELRVKTYKITNPQYILERARTLQLISGGEARYVTLGMPEGLAAK